MIKAVFFDVDDTLYDQLWPFQQAFQQAFPDIQAVDLTQLYSQFRQASDQIFPDYRASQLTTEQMWCWRMTQTLATVHTKKSDCEILNFQKYYNQNLTHIQLFAPYPAALARLKNQGYRLGIISNGTSQHQMTKVTALGMLQYVDQRHIYISETLRLDKPDPRLFQRVMKIESIPPAQCVYVGDHFLNDVVGAKQAGLKAIWFNHRQRQAAQLTIQPEGELTQVADLKWLPELVPQLIE